MSYRTDDRCFTLELALKRMVEEQDDTDRLMSMWQGALNILKVSGYYVDYRTYLLRPLPSTIRVYKETKDGMA